MLQEVGQFNLPVSVELYEHSPDQETRYQSTEELVEEHHREKGYCVKNLDPVGYNNGTTLREAENLPEYIDRKVGSVPIERGIPDLLVWKEDTYWFIEVKNTRSDALKPRQLLWMTAHGRLNICLALCYSSTEEGAVLDFFRQMTGGL